MEKTKQKTYGYDLWKALKSIQSNDFCYINQISEEEKENLLNSMFVIQRWLSNPENKSLKDYKLILNYINEFLNKYYIFLIQKNEIGNDHKILLWYLACAVPFEKNTRFGWIGIPKKNEKYKKIKDIFPFLSHEEIDIIVKNKDANEFIDEIISQEKDG